jgi:hypothetical protein
MAFPHASAKHAPAKGHKAPPKKGGSPALAGLKAAGPKLPSVGPKDAAGPPPSLGPGVPPIPSQGPAGAPQLDPHMPGGPHLKKSPANPLQGLQAALKEAQAAKLAQTLAAVGFQGG